MKPINAEPKIVLQPCFDQVAVGVDVAESLKVIGKALSNPLGSSAGKKQGS